MTDGHPFGRVLTLATVPLLVVLVAVLLAGTGLLPIPSTVNDGEVRVVSDGETLAVVDVEVANTPEERYTGLSEHESLADGEGMLFVHADEAPRTYVMREMDFGIDIVFVGADREITAIETAPAPGPGEDGEQIRRSGEAKWVLEVPAGYADRRGIEVGDRVEITYH